MSEFTVKALDTTTWAAYASLIERHGGIWGGCWCMEFHADGKEWGSNRRDKKACRVREGTAHACLVFQGDACIGWCQFGSPDELPRIKRKRAYDAVANPIPDWRITCFFVDKAHRSAGVADAALAGALSEIARQGGGLVESFPDDPSGRKVSSSFLHNASLSLFERHGFQKVRPLGANNWLVVTDVQKQD